MNSLKRIPVRSRQRTPVAADAYLLVEAVGTLDEQTFLTAVSNEIAAWAWLYAIVDAHPELRERFPGYTELRRVAVAKEIPVDHLRALVADLVANNLIIRAGSARGEFVRNYAKEHPRVAAGVLSSFLGNLNRFETSDDLEALVVATLYRKGLYQRAHAEDLELSRVRDEWQLLAARVQSEYERLRVAMENTMAVASANVRRAEQRSSAVLERANAVVGRAELSVADAVTRVANAVDEKLAEVTGRQDSLLQQTEERLEALRKTYVSQVALKAPVSFWRDKREMHDATAQRHRKFLQVAAPTVMVCLAALAWMILPPGEKITIRGIGLFLGIASVAIWFLRVVVRLWLTHVQLALDARERIVMAETYLSLIEDGVGTTDQERLIIMQALFKSASKAADADDGGPASVVELAGRVLGGSK